MKSSILNFLLLVLKIPLDLSPDANYKNSGFSKILPKKSLEFVPNRKNGTATFNLSLVLLPAEVDFISEK